MKSRDRVKRAKEIARELKKLFPQVDTTLRHKNNWELLVSVILSAQCTDKKVNEVTERLFKKYRSLGDYIDADVAEFEQDIKQTGFYKNKTKNILASAKRIKEEFSGKVPKTMEELLSLPGVARKTANVVLENAFGIVEGIAVDTHVKRLSRKLELVDSANPVVIEQELMKLFSREDWPGLTSRMIQYGRDICRAKTHECAEHPLTKIYPKAAHIWPSSS